MIKKGDTVRYAKDTHQVTGIMTVGDKLTAVWLSDGSRVTGEQIKKITVLK